METANMLIEAINKVGFPIVAYGLLFYFMNKTQKDNTSAINNNTVVMTKLADKLDKEESK